MGDKVACRIGEVNDVVDVSVIRLGKKEVWANGRNRPSSLNFGTGSPSLSQTNFCLITEWSLEFNSQNKIYILN